MNVKETKPNFSNLALSTAVLDGKNYLVTIKYDPVLKVTGPVVMEEMSGQYEVTEAFKLKAAYEVLK